MKCLAALLVVLIFLKPDPVTADDVQKTYFGVDDVVVEILMARPLGLVGTIVGIGVFTAISPLTALAQIAPPHDAFEKTADALVFAPAWFTFQRPLGYYCFDPRGMYSDPNCGSGY
jgi:hypothetical protein